MPTATQFAQCPVNSRYCGHPLDRKLVSLIAGLHKGRKSFQSNLCNLFVPARESEMATR